VKGGYEKRLSRSADAREASIVSQLKEWQNQFPGSQEFVDALKIDIFSDRIFVLTPQGEAIDLPVGSTPVDFAYRIHSEVGDSCVGAKVNSKIVPLDYQLQSGDLVEILTQKNKKPSEGWMGFIKTRYAAKKIKSSLNKKMPVPKKTEYRLTCEDRVGLMKDVSLVFSRNKIAIKSVSSNDDRFPVLKFVAEIQTKEKAEQILLKLKKIAGVREISYQLS
jgi:(p)ppGpp synthase/HD superfamily hydrolase